MRTRFLFLWVLLGLLAALMGPVVRGLPNHEGVGRWTREHPVVWGLVRLPFCLASVGSSAGLGALQGVVQGVVRAEEVFAYRALTQAKTDPVWVPLGVVGAVFAVPVGAVTGASLGALRSAQSTYQGWHRLS